MSLTRTSVVVALVGLCMVAGGAERALPDGTVALVNGEAVSRADFGRALVRSLGAAVVEEFVDWMLVEQEAAKKGVRATDKELEARRRLEVNLRMRLIPENARMSAEEFQRAAARHGWNEDTVRAEIERSISPKALRIRLLAERLLRPHITITDEDVRQYYESTQGERYAAAHVEVAAEKVARALIEKLKVEPEAWTDAVLRFSLDRASVPYKGRRLPVPVGSRLGEVLLGMKPGELKLYCDGKHWHVLQFISHIPASGQPFEQTEDALRKELYCRRVGSRVDSWLALLNARSTVVTNLSADPKVRGILGADTVVFVNGSAVPLSRLSDTLIELHGSKFIGPYIERLLIFQQARAAGIAVTEEQLSKRLSRLSKAMFAEQAAEQGVTPEEFRAFLTGSGMSPEQYRAERLRDSISLEDVRAMLLAEAMVSEGIEISQQDVQRAYQDCYGERIAVRRIILDDAAKAEGVYKQALLGADFELLVQTESAEPLAWMHKGLVSNITAQHPYFDRVKDLRQGRLSGVFRRHGQYHILKVVSRHAPKEAPPLDTVRDAIREEVRREKIRTRIEAWLVKLTAEAEIEIDLR